MARGRVGRDRDGAGEDAAPPVVARTITSELDGPDPDAATVPAAPAGRRAQALGRPERRAPAPATQPPDQPPGAGALRELDRDDYLVGEEVARGGMGRVMRAVDRRLGRVVALKQLDDETPRRRERFAREAQITARLQHPSIVPIYEAGRWVDGGLAYAMKLVSGRPLQQAIDETTDLADRLALLPRLTDVVDAVAYAHRQGVVHRDIKPSNIILGEFGETILIDWGIAKLLGAPESTDERDGVAPAPEPDPPGDLHAAEDVAGLTVPGSVIGTPAYMAPEQAAGDAVDERADVYALGAMLYHLLAGKHPYRGADATSIMERVIAGPPPPLDQVEPRAPAELVAVVARAMDRVPAARYGAAELAAELRRFATGQLVASYRYTAGERLARLVRRHRAAVAVGAAAVVALGALAAVSARRIVQERDRAELLRARATDRVDELTVEKARMEVEARPALELLAGLSPGSRHWSAARVVAADVASRGVPRELGRHPGTLRQLHFLTSDTLISAEADRLHLWDVASGARRTLECGELLDLAPEGAAALVRRAGQLERVALPGGEVTPLGPAPADLRAAALSGDGRLAAVATGGHTSLLAPGTPPRVLGPAPSAGVLRFAPGGDLLLAVTDMTLNDPRAEPGRGPGLGAWSLPDGTWLQISQLEFADPAFVVLSPDGRRVATRTAAGALYVLGTRDGTFSVQNLSPFLPGSAEGRSVRIPAVTRLAFAPDGERYVVADSDQQVRLIGGGPETRIATRDAEVTGIAFLPDGSGVLAASRDGTVTHWRIGAGFTSGFAHGRAVVGMAVSPDSRLVATATEDGVLRTVRLPPASERRIGRPIAAAALAADGSGVVLPADDGGALLRWAGDGELAPLGPCPPPVTALVAAPGRAAALCAGAPWLWREGDAALRPAGDGGAVRALAMTGSGILLGWTEDGALWRSGPEAGGARRLARVAPVGEHLAGSVDGGHAVAAGGREVARIDLSSGAVVRHALEGEPVRAVAIAPGGALVAASRADGTITLIDGAGRQRALRGHTIPATALAFAPDGRTLVSGADDGVVAAWDVELGGRRWLTGHRRPVLAVAAGAGQIWSIDAAVLRQAPDDLPHGEAALRAWIAGALAAPGASAALRD